MNLPVPKFQQFLDRYVDLIEYATANQQCISTSLESHHILPRSMGGSSNTENLVNLTTEQHYEAHYLLWHAYRNQQMSCAFHLMTTNKSDRRQLTHDEFSQLREDYKNSKKEYWKNLSDDERKEHSIRSNPWKNLSDDEKDIYRKKCNSWVNKTELEIINIKQKCHVTWMNKTKEEKARTDEQKIAQKASLKNTIIKRAENVNWKENCNYTGYLFAGSIWINNGIINKRILSDEVPVGWERGRIKKGYKH